MLSNKNILNSWIGSNTTPPSVGNFNQVGVVLQKRQQVIIDKISVFPSFSGFITVGLTSNWVFSGLQQSAQNIFVTDDVFSTLSCGGNTIGIDAINVAAPVSFNLKYIVTNGIQLDIDIGYVITVTPNFGANNIAFFIQAMTSNSGIGATIYGRASP